MRELVVWLGDRPVGLLSEDGGSMAFEYDQSWRSEPADRPLSLRLPPREAPYGDDACRSFFGGLLPEGPVRNHLARRFGISPGNDFSLLEKIGGDCAGAVSLLPLGTSPGSDGPEHDRLDDGRLAALIAGLPSRPLGVGVDGEIRLSLAGAQDKLPIHVDGDGRFALPRGRAASSHIIKAPLPQQDSVLNEAICLALARELGLDAAEATPRHVAGQEFLLVTRYDRRREGEDLVRLHQEDFGQALGVPTSAKYESEGGPNAVACLRLLRDHSARPAHDVLAFTDALMLNVLIGNTDAHSKNFSVLLEPPGPRLAPLYDLLCTRCYTGLTRRMAMRVGGVDDADHLADRHWARFAEAAGLGVAALRRRRRALAARAEEAVHTVVGRFAAEGWDRPIGARIAGEVSRRARQLARIS